MKTILLIAAVIASTLSFASQADAKSSKAHHIDQLAYNAQVYTQNISYTVRRYLLSQRNSKHLINDISKMQKLAKHVHDLAHQLERGRPVLKHLRHDVAELDSLMHHVERLVSSMKSDLYRKLNHRNHSHRTQIRVTRHNGHIHVTRTRGHHHNNHNTALIRYQLSVLKRVEVMTQQLENTVHHLQHDLRH